MAFNIHQTKLFKTICIHHLRDTNLSWQAKGMLSFMFSNKEDFKYSINGLAQCSTNGDKSVRSILDELKTNGYLIITPKKGADGRIECWDYDIFQTPEEAKLFSSNPDAEKAHVENEHVGKAHVENEQQSNNKRSNNKEKDNSSSNSPIINNSPITPTNTPFIPQGGKQNNKYVLDLSAVRPDFAPVVLKWLTYKKERGQAYKQMGFNSFYKKLIDLSNGDPFLADTIVEQSMSNNYQGIFELKGGNNGNTTSRPTDAQVLRAAIDQSWGPCGDPLADIL